jgi:hypothetical protein
MIVETVVIRIGTHAFARWLRRGLGDMPAPTAHCFVADTDTVAQFEGLLLAVKRHVLEILS